MAQAQAADCHLRSSGVIIVDQKDEIVFADLEATEVLRGPAEEWNGDDAPLSLRDGSYSGSLHDYWRFTECFTVSDNTSNKDNLSCHHYLVVERAEDSAVVWVQACVHFSPAEDGRELYVWSVRDISGPARCLEMSRLTTADDYTLSLEDDGFPHTPLLTQAPTDCDPERARDELGELLEKAATTECFSVLYLTGFGAVDSVFPRRMLGWGEADLLDRSFIGLLSPEDRIFFCRALRRCYHDRIPQRLILRMASALLAEEGHLPEMHIYADCDVTVLMPEAVQQPVLVVRANDPRQGRHPPELMSDAPTPLSVCAMRRQVVERVRLDCTSAPLASPPPAGTLLSRIGDVLPHLSPPSPSLSTTSSAADWGQCRGRRNSMQMGLEAGGKKADALSRASTCASTLADDMPESTDLSKHRMDVSTTLTIHMSDIFAYAPDRPHSLAAAATLCERSPSVMVHPTECQSPMADFLQGLKH
ncbi:hypothetical protein GGI20_000489 [Coemansia sp. BCRC 34301]|nr:hypothetical protein GGI20_000489 [Coemansia sp. BCRC 34301]